jgi:hypothetical protein
MPSSALKKSRPADGVSEAGRRAADGADQATGEQAVQPGEVGAEVMDQPSAERRAVAVPELAAGDEEDAAAERLQAIDARDEAGGKRSGVEIGDQRGDRRRRRTAFGPGETRQQERSQHPSVANQGVLLAVLTNRIT